MIAYDRPSQLLDGRHRADGPLKRHRRVEKRKGARDSRGGEREGVRGEEKKVRKVKKVRLRNVFGSTVVYDF